MQRAKQPMDMWLFLLTVAFLVIGIALVYDASFATAALSMYTGKDTAYFAKRQAVFAVTGLVVLLIAQRIPYWKYKRFAFSFLVLSIIALCLVFIKPFGVEANGAKRWIAIPGMPLQIQPSELAKLALVLYLATYVANKQRHIRQWKYGLLPALIPIGLVCALTVIEPDMGTCIVMLVVGMAVLVMGGAKKRQIALVFAGIIPLTILLILVEPYRLSRVTSFVDPWKDYEGSGYQVCRSLIALGTGGLRGVGICEGREKRFYLPAGHTDFIVAVLGEEMGLIGTLSLAGLFFAFGVLGYRIAIRTRENFAKLLAAGLTTLICGQAFLNMAVVSSMLPTTGVPLPFISYGGSSLVLNLLSVGVILGISKYPGFAKEYVNYESRYNRRRDRRPRVSGYQRSRVSAN